MNHILVRAPICLAGLLMATIAAGAADSESKTVEANVNVTVGKRPGTTESVTVNTTAANGASVTVTKEVVGDTKAEAHKTIATPADTAARAPRMIVTPASYVKDVRTTFMRELKEKWGFEDPAALENPGYSSFLIDSLVNAHAYDVLERERLDSVIKELDFGESDYADVSKVVRLGGMLNADYVVIPEIRYFAILDHVKDVPYINTKTRSLRCKLSVSVRVVEVSSSKIAVSALEDALVTSSLRRQNDSPSSPVRDVIDEAYKVSAKQVTARIQASPLNAPAK